MAGLFASLFAELGRAIADAREKVVETGWFGKPLDEAATVERWNEITGKCTDIWVSAEEKADDAKAHDDRKAFAEQWARANGREPTAARDIPDQGMDL